MDSKDEGTKDEKINKIINIKQKDLKKEKCDNLNLINEEEICHKIKIFPFYLSEFGLFAIILFIVLISYLIPQYFPGKLFHSKKSVSPFNSNYIPKILIHITDVHVSHRKPEKTNDSITFIKEVVEYKPDLILTTGDYVDNYEEWKFQNFGNQRKPDWEIYNNSIIPLLSEFNVIDIPGNHDVWALDSAISEYNYFLDCSFIYNRTNVKNNDDFFIRKINNMNLTFILFNDYRFPVSRPPYGLDSHTSKHQLDLLENMIDNLEEEECFILSHYNVERTWFQKSTKGHTFYEIISKKKVAALFTGHYHPKKVGIVHHGSEGGLEFCTSTPFKKHRAGLITIDNDNFIYHEIYISSPGKKPLFIMTYPVPNEQISGHHIFNMNNFEIRVLSFITDKNITLRVEGDIEGELEYKMTINNGAILYSLPVNLTNGSYKIHAFDIDRKLCDINREFFIGESYKGKKEKGISNQRALLIIRLSAIPMLIILFIIIFPIRCGNQFKIILSLENYINGNNYELINSFLKYFLLIILGPFISRNRFLKLNAFSRYSIFILSLYPIILPIHIFNKMNGKIGFAFNVFIVIGKYFQYEHWAMEITYIYYLTIIIPNVLYVTSLKTNKIIYLFNLITSYVIIIGTLVINFNALSQTTSFIYLFFTPYIILLIIIKIIVHFFSYVENSNKINNSIN